MKTKTYYFSRFLTLNEIINALDESDEEFFQNSYDISIVPTQAANNYVTDEDSGEEDEVNFENLPPLLLNAEAELFRNSYSTDSDSEDDIPLALLQQAKKRKCIKSSVEWVKHDLEETEPIITACEQEILPTPLELLEKFFDGDFLHVITQYSNDYASKQNATANITPDEIRCFIGILLLSGYNTVSRRRMYWQIDRDTHNSFVSNAMRRDRFEFIIRNLHFVDNNSLDKTDKFAKVRPLIQMLNKSFQSHAPKTIQHSVDEQMVPYYGSHGCKQYIHGKPIRYGYKFWVGATYKGYIIWFEPYQGAGTFPNNTYKEMGLGPSVVLTYCDILSQSQPDIAHRLYFDNLFTTINLLAELEERRLKGTGTIRHNRLGNCPLLKKKDLQKRDKGWYDYRKISTNNIIVCCWNDSSAVNVASNFHPVEPSKNISRWSRKEKKRIYVQQPRLIHEYNRYMGGVDRADENISLYRVSIRGKKWYFPIFTHLIDLAEHNAWQLHRHMGGKMDHLSFRRRISTLLISTYGKPSATLPSGSSCDIRFDRKDHLLTENTRQADGKCKQLRCNHCHNKTTTRCIKCDVPLHVKCNVEYHTTK